MQRLLEIMRQLRAPEGCPWDRKQTHESLRPYLLEEAAEAVDAIGIGEADAIAEELGDVLLQIAFHSVIAEEEKSFSYETVEASIVDKLIRRHPHVFSDTKVTSADEVVANWQEIKKSEKKPASLAESVPHSLPTLMRAAELSKKLAWDEMNVQQDIAEGLQEPNHQTIGQALLALASFARATGINPDIALRDAIQEKLKP